ncbi:hypothetical protein BOX15_Mlig028502g1 [Macrostomum lignano]|uniref:COMM domain-containing protein n=1 Tax=Macrostomum lignano TaxID=282301 RepID=A0A267FP25_9PLAT|nr:hypothetical protein BOX15_Mlig028502g1 [Macrostomum lignano]
MKLYQQVSIKLFNASFQTVLESFASHEVIEELCTMAESTFSSKLNPKLIANAASKCQVDKAEMQRLIDCLSLLLETSARLSCETKEVEECLLLCGAPAGVASGIAAHTAANQAALRDHLAHLDSAALALSPCQPTAPSMRSSRPTSQQSLPAFHSLRWRFDVEIASRCLGDQIVPLLKLHLVTQSADGRRTSHWLQTDPNNLRHLVESLEAALTAGQTNHAQRIVRYVK